MVVYCAVDVAVYIGVTADYVIILVNVNDVLWHGIVMSIHVAVFRFDKFASMSFDCLYKSEKGIISKAILPWWSVTS